MCSLDSVVNTLRALSPLIFTTIPMICAIFISTLEMNKLRKLRHTAYKGFAQGHIIVSGESEV